MIEPATRTHRTSYQNPGSYNLPTNARGQLRKIESTAEKTDSTSFKYAERASNSSNFLVQISTFISNETTRYLSMTKFMQSLGPETYQRLATEAKLRDVTVQSLIRTVIVPEWLKNAPSAIQNTQPTLSKTIVQPTSLLSQTGILATPARRSFLNASIGRARQ